MSYVDVPERAVEPKSTEAALLPPDAIVALAGEVWQLLAGHPRAIPSRDIRGFLAFAAEIATSIGIKGEDLEEFLLHSAKHYVAATVAGQVSGAFSKSLGFARGRLQLGGGFLGVSHHPQHGQPQP